MVNFSNHSIKINLLALHTAFFLVLGCASIQQPTGGPKDRTPPKILKETPANLTRNFAAKQVTIQFDEFIKLSNEIKEISVSPEMDRQPIFKVVKKNLEIKFQDTLQKNTTYTINFGKAIVDYNEGNILKNYSYVFSTGSVIDSLNISGNVINSISGKPEMETSVFVIPISQDSIFGKKRASLFTTTDSSGNFQLKNLRSDKYRIYALKEEANGGDRIFNSAEEWIAFQKDSIDLKANVENIKLQTFKEVPSIFRNLEKKILGDGHILFTFNRPLEKPTLKILDPHEFESKKVAEFNKRGDSVLMWLPEVKFDSIKVSVSDNSIALDTITLKRNKRDTYKPDISISDNLASGRITTKTAVLLNLTAPIQNIDQTKFKLSEDSIPVTNFSLIKDSLSARRYKLIYPWRGNRQYELSIADNAFTSIMGGKNKSYSKIFTAYVDDNFGNLVLNFTLPDSTNADSSKSYVVQLLNANQEIVHENIIKKKQPVQYIGLTSGKYTVSVVYDLNKNGKWDTGNVKARIQPEPIWNYDKELSLRPNWDLEEKITIPPPSSP